MGNDYISSLEEALLDIVDSMGAAGECECVSCTRERAALDRNQTIISEAMKGQALLKQMAEAAERVEEQGP